MSCPVHNLLHCSCLFILQEEQQITWYGAVRHISKRWYGIGFQNYQYHKNRPLAYLNTCIHYRSLSFCRSDVLFRKCRNVYWRFHADLAAVGSPYTAACTGRNSLPSASQTQETIHYIIKCSGNVLYIGHHIFLQGLRCYMGKTSFMCDYSIDRMVLGL